MLLALRDLERASDQWTEKQKVFIEYYSLSKKQKSCYKNLYSPSMTRGFHFVRVRTYHFAKGHVLYRRATPSSSVSASASNVIMRRALVGVIPFSKPFKAILPNPPQHPLDSVQTPVQVLEGRAERDPDEVVARRIEEVPAVRGVDVEEDSRDHDRLFLEELFEEGLVWVSWGLYRGKTRG